MSYVYYVIFDDVCECLLMYLNIYFYILFYHKINYFFLLYQLYDINNTIIIPIAIITILLKLFPDEKSIIKPYNIVINPANNKPFLIGTVLIKSDNNIAIIPAIYNPITLLDLLFET